MSTTAQLEGITRNPCVRCGSPGRVQHIFGAAVSVCDGCANLISGPGRPRPVCWPPPAWTDPRGA